MPARVLILDGDPLIEHLFKELLQEEGYHVVAGDMREYDLGAILCNPPHLIILDHLFGDSSPGQCLLQQLYAQPLARSIPVIVCSAALPELQQVREHYPEPPVYTVEKPFAVDHLLATIQKALANRPSRVENE